MQCIYNTSFPQDKMIWAHLISTTDYRLLKWVKLIFLNPVTIRQPSVAEATNEELRDREVKAGRATRHQLAFSVHDHVDSNKHDCPMTICVISSDIAHLSCRPPSGRPRAKIVGWTRGREAVSKESPGVTILTEDDGTSIIQTSKLSTSDSGSYVLRTGRVR